MWFRTSLKYVGGALLAIGLLWWVLHDTDPHILWSHLRDASIPLLILAAAANIAQNIFRVLRWRALLEPVRPNVPFRPMFDAVILGYAASWIIPGRVGEVLRPAMLAGRERLPIGPCFGSVLADRLLDGMAVLVLFGVGVLLTPLTGEAAEHASVVRVSAAVLVGLIAVPIAVLLLASNAGSGWKRDLQSRRGWRGWLGRALLSLSQGVEALKRPVLFTRIALHTLLAWLLIAASTWLGVRAIGVDLSFQGTLVLLPLLVLGIALPTPGGAGGYHAAMQFGLMQLFGVGETLAEGAGILQHLVVVLPIIALGALLLIIGRIPIQDLVQAARQVRGMGSPSAPAPPAAQPMEKLS